MTDQMRNGRASMSAATIGSVLTYAVLGFTAPAVIRGRPTPETPPAGINASLFPAGIFTAVFHCMSRFSDFSIQKQLPIRTISDP
jgi:hypothetical protein